MYMRHVRNVPAVHAYRYACFNVHSLLRVWVTTGRLGAPAGVPVARVRAATYAPGCNRPSVSRNQLGRPKQAGEVSRSGTGTQHSDARLDGSHNCNTGFVVSSSIACFLRGHVVLARSVWHDSTCRGRRRAYFPRALPPGRHRVACRRSRTKLLPLDQRHGRGGEGMGGGL